MKHRSRYQSTWELWQPFARSHKLQVVGAVIIGFVANYATLLLTLSIGNFFELVLGAGGGKSQALNMLGPGVSRTVPAFFLFFFIVLLLKFLLGWMNQYVAGVLGSRFARELRDGLLHARIMNRHACHRNSGHNNVGGPGEDRKVLMPFTTDMGQMHRLVTKGILGLVRDLLFVMMAFYVLYRLQARLTLLAVAFLAVSYLLLRWHNRSSENTVRRKRKRSTALWSMAQHMLSQQGLPSDAEMERFRDLSGKQALAQNQHLWKKSLLNALAPAMLYLLLGLIMMTIALGRTEMQPAAADLVTFILLLITLFPTLRNILKVEQVWVQACISGTKFLRPENQAYLYPVEPERCQSG